MYGATSFLVFELDITEINHTKKTINPTNHLVNIAAPTNSPMSMANITCFFFILAMVYSTQLQIPSVKIKTLHHYGQYGNNLRPVQ